VRVGGGGSRRGERTGDKGEQDGKNDEAIHVAFPFRRQLTASTWGLVTRIVMPTVGTADRDRIIRIDEDS
jgi:hypothetical protein